MEQYSGLISIALMFAIFYFLLIRPQQKRQKERSAMLDALKKGDKVVTLGGMHGSIVELDDDTAVLRIAENLKVTFERSAISHVKTED